MPAIHVILLIFAVVCFALDTFGTVTPRINLQSLGLALGTVALLLR